MGKVAIHDLTPIFMTPIFQKAQIRASDYCIKLNQAFVPISSSAEVRGNYSLQFKCLDRNDPESRKNHWDGDTNFKIDSDIKLDKTIEHK